MLWLKEMYDKFNKVDHHPRCAVVATCLPRWRAVRFAEVFKCLGARTHLPFTRARTNQDVVADLAETSHVKQGDIAALVVFK